VNTTIYSLEDIRKIVRHIGLDNIMDDTIFELTSACELYSEQQHVVPERDGFDYSEPYPGLIEWMPAMTRGEDVAIKVVGYHPQNPAQHTLPTIMSTCLDFDAKTGHLTTIIDGNLLTAVRTGAASAVASRILAGPDSHVLGLIGCGAQAITQLHALSRVFKLRRVLIYDKSTHAKNSFAERATFIGLDGIEILPSALEDVVGRAEILCTATSVAVGAGPVFDKIALRSDVHINAVGSDFPGKTELPLSVLKNALVCPDFTAQALKEGESQQLNPDQLGPDLVELVKNQGEYSAQQPKRTVYDSTGWALQDRVIMKLFARYGRELGCGTEVALANVTVDPLNPYGALGIAAANHRKTS